MGSELRQRALLAARVVAVLAAVAIVLVVAARTRSNPKDTVATKTTPTPSATHPPSAGPAQVTAELSLCQEVPDLVRFALQVLGPPHQSGAINVSNAGTDVLAAQVKAAASQLCALPVLPAKPASCLGNAGPWFQLIFAAADGAFWTVWAASGGCEQVIGVGDQTRTAVSVGPRLWPTLLADLRGSQPLGP